MNKHPSTVSYINTLSQGIMIKLGDKVANVKIMLKFW